MGDDAIRTGIVVLIISALGTGILTLHHYFDQIGIFVGLGILLVVSLAFILSSDILIYSLKKSQNAKSLNQLVEKILGTKFRIVFDLLFFIYLLLALISIILTVSKTFYLNFGRPIMENYFHYVFKDEADFRLHFKDFNKYFSYIVGAIMFLLIIQKDV